MANILAHNELQRSCRESLQSPYAPIFGRLGLTHWRTAGYKSPYTFWAKVGTLCKSLWP